MASACHMRWSVAFDKYALGAAAAKQMTWGAAAAHKDVCMWVALTAEIDKRRAILGVIYDELTRQGHSLLFLLRRVLVEIVFMRKSWAERSKAGEWQFDIEIAAGRVDDGLLRQARTVYDEASAPPKAEVAAGGGKGGKGKGGEAITCYKCGKSGHVAAQCWSNYSNKGKGDLVCYTYGKSGHKSNECYSKRKRLADGTHKYS